MGEQDLQTLRLQGFGDAAIHDATQIIAYFNYINRIAEALGVEPETFIDPPWGDHNDVYSGRYPSRLGTAWQVRQRAS